MKKYIMILAVVMAFVGVSYGQSTETQVDLRKMAKSTNEVAPSYEVVKVTPTNNGSTSSDLVTRKAAFHTLSEKETRRVSRENTSVQKSAAMPWTDAQFKEHCESLLNNPNSSAAVKEKAQLGLDNLNSKTK